MNRLLRILMITLVMTATAVLPLGGAFAAENASKDQAAGKSAVEKQVTGKSAVEKQVTEKSSVSAMHKGAGEEIPMADPLQVKADEFINPAEEFLFPFDLSTGTYQDIILDTGWNFGLFAVQAEFDPDYDESVPENALKIEVLDSKGKAIQMNTFDPVPDVLTTKVFRLEEKSKYTIRITASDALRQAGPSGEVELSLIVPDDETWGKGGDAYTCKIKANGKRLAFCPFPYQSGDIVISGKTSSRKNGTKPRLFLTQIDADQNLTWEELPIDKQDVIKLKKSGTYALAALETSESGSCKIWVEYDKAKPRLKPTLMDATFKTKAHSVSGNLKLLVPGITYQLRWSTDKKFKKGVKKRTFLHDSRVYWEPYKITKLKSGKKYYIQIRGYRVVNGKEYGYGWSKAKTFTTK